ncbi:MAG: glutamyl-tRNA reductase [Bacteroidota bacterium]
MKLYVLGLNHERASVAQREAFALTTDALVRFYARWRRATAASCVVVSTCNRTDVVIHGTDRDVALAEALLAAEAATSWPNAVAFVYDDEGAVRHVLSVAGGLRSLVLGDAQILHQVKAAYHAAVEADAVDSVLHRLFHTAFQSAKRVRTETGLARGAASVSSLAVSIAQAQAPGRCLNGQHVVLVGAGQMALAALNALTRYQLASLTITNRSEQRAAALARRYGGQAHPWNDRHAVIAAADVVLVATGAREPVVSAQALPPRCPTRPALLIDIAVPRNVELTVDARPGYVVLDLDALSEGVAATAAARQAALPDAQAIVEEHLAEFVTWFFHQHALQPTIQTIRSTFEAIRRQEVDRHGHRIPEMARPDVERLTQSIMQKLLAVPIVRLKATDPDSLDFVRGIQALATMFAQPGTQPASEAFGSRPASKPSGGCPFAHGGVNGTHRLPEETATHTTRDAFPVETSTACSTERCAGCRSATSHARSSA